MSLSKILIISLLYVAGTSSVQAEEKKAEHSHEHEHEHSEQTNMGMVLNEGKKWQTDDPLRKGMQSIHDAVENSEKAFASKTLTQKEGEVLASHINKQLMYMVENCELQPKADASLHVIIGEMMQGVGELSKVPDSQGGFPRIHKALKQYPKFFDHPNFEK
ncbi:MAG: hypothetical protein V3U71_02515 [Cocleimonas sp.]